MRSPSPRPGRFCAVSCVPSSRRRSHERGSMTTGREWQLARRPKGWPQPEDFRLVEVDVAEPADGEVLVRNLVMSVDPYMRGRMNDAPSYAAPYQIDQPMYGGAGGRVEASKVAGIEPGAIVRNGLGRRAEEVVPGRRAERLEPQADGVPGQACL